MQKTVIMPKSLTAENGAKGLLIGEFFEHVTMSCLYCDDGQNDGDVCEECDGAGSFTLKVPVSWTTIKDIYAKAVEHFAGA